MDYRVTLDGKTVAVPYHQFIAWNDEHSARWHDTADAAERRRIQAFLFELNLPLFQSWNIFDPDDRQDFEQQAYFHFDRALRTFKPGSGAFVAWLKRWYVKKAWTEKSEEISRDTDILAASAAPGSHIEPIADETVDRIYRRRIAGITESTAPSVAPDPIDPIFGARLRKLLTHQQYRILDLRVFQAQRMEDVAAAVGLSVTTTAARLAEALQAAKVEMARGSGAARTPEAPTDGSRFLTRPAFAHLFQLTMAYLKVVLNPGLTQRHSPYFIDPRDTVPLQGGRIRYLESPAGLVYPRLIQRQAKIGQKQ